MKTVADEPVASSTATWHSVAARIERDIAAGRLAEGDKLPTEVMMCRTFGITRHTMRRAIAALVERGLLRSVPHGGTFVSLVRVPFLLAAPDRFADGLAKAGFQPRGREISRNTGPAPPDIAEKLGVARLTNVAELVHLRLASDIPLCLVTTWCPADRFGRLAELYAKTGSVRRAFAKMGVGCYRRKSARISCRVANAAECLHLGLSKGSVVIVMEALHADVSGEPINVTIHRFSADRVEFILEP